MAKYNERGKTARIMSGNGMLMARLKSPEQVCRIDGRACFLELLTIGLPFDKVVMNFVSYNTGEAKGKRVSSSVMVFLGVHDAEVFAETILSGQMAKKGEQAKKVAAENGYKYAREVFCSMTGTAAAKSTRSDGAATSRQLKLTPGTKQPWVLSAESGPGREERTGIIAPAYPGGKPECIIRIPLSHDNLKSLALSIRSLVSLWYESRFSAIIGSKMPPISEKTPAFVINKGTEALQVFVNTLTIDQLLLDFNGGKGQMYLNIFKAQVLANDLLSGRIFKTAKANPSEPAYCTYGGGKRGSGIYCRTFSITMLSDTTWQLHTESGKGKLSNDGMILPDYDKPDREASVTITSGELIELGFALRGLAQAWMNRKFSHLVEEPIQEAIKATEKELAAIRASAT